jgi:hypothetical protein
VHLPPAAGGRVPHKAVAVVIMVATEDLQEVMVWNPCLESSVFRIPTVTTVNLREEQVTKCDF